MRSKPFYTQIFSYDTSQMQKKRQSWHAGNITDITDWMRPLQWMFKVSASATSVDASVQTLATAGDWLKTPSYENLNIFKPP